MDFFLHHYSCVLSVIVHFQKIVVMEISEKSFQNVIWTRYWRDMLQCSCARGALNIQTLVEGFVYTSHVVILTCIFDPNT